MSDLPPEGPRKQGPILFDLDEQQPPLSPSEAPPVPEPDLPGPQGQAMTTAAALAARQPSKLARWFWALAGTLVSALISIAAWRFAMDLIASVPLLGLAVSVLMGLVVLVGLAIVVKELAAMSRLAKVDALHRAADAALASDDLKAARKVVDQLSNLYAGREDTRWGRERLKERGAEVFDASGLIGLAENELLAPLDAAARREVEASARQVATVTALVPLALADVVAALSSNLRMIRRIAEIYGGRSGTLGSWRLTRAVMSHLVATGAVAVGDDMLEPVLGGGLLGKLSRRFGEGLVNGALTARVGVAAIEVCRPLPFTRRNRPSVREIIRTALAGFVIKESGKG
ncbi:MULTISPECIES: YcjF family protein [unclassified Salipiger]|uniref:YcjF family protein n=1 Tax=unclassified Salipiger TaxID=2640570 RepID=UPI0013BB9321|nr:MULTISPECIES: TIGR01620 family protein [unclassified Salipiger]NDV49100.1 TIGR01620 family protein [Salipiger sp. PrR003]NDW31358.1 TIGR01620 family protein [Salipiger sp. PrR007]